MKSGYMLCMHLSAAASENYCLPCKACYVVFFVWEVILECFVTYCEILLIVWCVLPAPRRSCLTLCLSVCLSVCQQLHIITTDRICMRILPETCLCTRKMPLNLGSHPPVDPSTLQDSALFSTALATSLATVVCSSLQLMTSFFKLVPELSVNSPSHRK